MPMLLQNKRIGITRSVAQSQDFAAGISENGGIPVVCPLLKLNQVTLSDVDIKRCISELIASEWVVFTSANALKFLLKYPVIDILKKKKCAVVGIKTMAVLKKHDLSVALIPDRFTAEHLADALIQHAVPGTEIFFPTGNLADPALINQLTGAGMKVRKWMMYETIADERSVQRLKELIAFNKIDVLTFFSPSAVRFFSRTITDMDHCALPVIACVGKVTANEAQAFGIPVSIVPDRYTGEELIRAIGSYFKEDED